MTVAVPSRPSDNFQILVAHKEALTAIGEVKEQAAKLFEQRTDLKMVEKANYKAILNQLASYYKSKKQLDKAKVYEDKAKSLG